MWPNKKILGRILGLEMGFQMLIQIWMRNVTLRVYRKTTNTIQSKKALTLSQKVNSTVKRKKKVTSLWPVNPGRE